MKIDSLAILCRCLRYFIVMALFSCRKSERRRCGTQHTEQHLLRSLARQKSLTSLTQHRHRSELQNYKSSLRTHHCLHVVASHRNVVLPYLITLYICLSHMCPP